eukprot:gene14610-biopygen5128
MPAPTVLPSVSQLPAQSPPAPWYVQKLTCAQVRAFRRKAVAFRRKAVACRKACHKTYSFSQLLRIFCGTGLFAVRKAA